MNFKEQLVDSSRIIGEMVTANVGNNPEYFSQIVNLTLYEKMPMQSRAGRVFYLSVEKYPYLITPHIDTILEYAQQGHILHRSILWAFAELKPELNEKQEGVLLDLCFEWLEQKELEVAIEISCYTILFNFVKKEPDLGPELAAIIEERMPHGTPGIRNRGGRILKAMQKMGAI